jgi:hypothetical protein
MYMTPNFFFFDSTIDNPRILPLGFFSIYDEYEKVFFFVYKKKIVLCTSYIKKAMSHRENK